jgi:hypothetical protein
VHEQQRRLEALVEQVGEELGQLRGGEHALVDERARRQRREVGGDLLLELVLDPLAADERLAVEVDARRSRQGSGDDELAEARHRRPRGGAEARGIDRHVTPGEDLQSLVGHDGLDRRLRLLGGDVVGGEEDQADGVAAHRWERCPLVGEHGAQEAVRDLDEDAGAVAGVGLGAGGAAMGEVGEGSEPDADELAAGHALDVGDERHPARVVLESRIVEADLARRSVHRPSHPRKSGGLGWTSGTTLSRTVGAVYAAARRATTPILVPSRPGGGC